MQVTQLGYGSAELGIKHVSQDEADKVLAAVLDAGINFIDTAACYEDSEVKIGQAIADRRDEYVLLSKCGHGLDDLDEPAWSGSIVTASIERSLRRCRTDHLDIILLHSCNSGQLKNEEMLNALSKAKHDGKVRYIGYSGDGDTAEQAVNLGLFDALETSVNIADQQCLETYLPKADQAGLGIIAKRPIANSAWRNLDELGDFYSDYAADYAERIQQMQMSPEAVGFDGDWIEMALRFSAFEENVDVAVVGSSNPEHIRQNIAVLENGGLPTDTQRKLRRLWEEHDDGSWVGQT
ncbi:MAG: aldo/keto reductase [Planctomycetota bacterium]